MWWGAVQLLFSWIWQNVYGWTPIIAALHFIAIFAATPPEKAGVVGSIFNCFLQLGCAAGSAIITSIQTSVDASHGGPTVWTGRAAGLWFLFGLLAVETLCIMVFMHNTMPPTTHILQKKQKRMDTPEIAD
ncbi:hypothetical protein C0989_008935 [Termitomyces sp. Mn162]|nr:hypothetical protein C0989_008935 [Termitomyces sp. Mn162]